MTFVAIREDLIGQHRSDTPYMLEWKLFADHPDGFFNTPATWPIYVAGLNIKHMLKEGGIEAQTEKAKVRSSMLYSYIDSSEGYYVNVVEKKYRSRMNAVFTIGPHHFGYTDLEKKFFAESTKMGLAQLKGLPTYGGIRVSMYNAMPVEGIVLLTAFMEKFRLANLLP
jgi:phosphoserine aminotransferase